VIWERERWEGLQKESCSFWFIFISIPFQSFLGLAVVSLLPAPPMLSYPFDASEWWKGSGLLWRDSSSVILSILEDTIQFLKFPKIFRKEI
jgi:hypothetical protein